jgi:hypothetical protein
MDLIYTNTDHHRELFRRVVRKLVWAFKKIKRASGAPLLRRVARAGLPVLRTFPQVRLVEDRVEVRRLNTLLRFIMAMLNELGELDDVIDALYSVMCFLEPLES